MRVWVTPRKTYTDQKFHRHVECPRLARSKGEPVQVALDNLGKASPCLWCYPTAPVVPSVWHRWCPECNKDRVYPCPHNGGVLAEVPMARTSGDRGGSNRGVYVRYVWIENAWKYRLVGS